MGPSDIVWVDGRYGSPAKTNQFNHQFLMTDDDFGDLLSSLYCDQ